MTPATRYAQFDSPVGPLTLIGTATGALQQLLFDSPRVAELTAPLQRDDAVFAAPLAQLREYFEGKRQRFELDLGGAGTTFQQRVWKALVEIPFGETTSYGALARGLGDERAVRAVGAANGRNPLAIVVPCHRVIGADGSMTGFAGGIERKRWLLAHEARHSAKTLF